MLRRDTEYVLTWNAQNHSWLVRPIERDGNQIVQIGGGTQMGDPAWAVGSYGGVWED
ncbi:hypothetical protein [Jiangella gansuensis]|uniref:hypothetical protein n=1 Tax=Jiangella gansuensis TaxID=281473 RepID=UPI0004B31C3D|nr:hypothetical protein [Jiangella gansuensis]